MPRAPTRTDWLQLNDADEAQATSQVEVEVRTVSLAALGHTKATTSLTRLVDGRILADDRGRVTCARTRMSSMKQ